MADFGRYINKHSAPIEDRRGDTTLTPGAAAALGETPSTRNDDIALLLDAALGMQTGLTPNTVYGQKPLEDDLIKIIQSMGMTPDGMTPLQDNRTPVVDRTQFPDRARRFGLGF